MDVQQQILIEQKIGNSKPSAGVAYLLAIFLGIFGAHRFYLGRAGSGIVMLLLTLTFFGIIITSIWTLVDLFLIPGMIRDDTEKLRQKLTIEAMSNQPAVVMAAPMPVQSPTTIVPPTQL